ncbi:MAG TPA: PAS domain S-box protein [Anaerolineae bacterium]|nr:PAS domain S-box protein [Anaerolineae bacterium]
MLLTRRRFSINNTQARERFFEEILLLRQDLAEISALVAEQTETGVGQNSHESPFATLLDLSVDAILVVDESQRILLFNQGAEHTFGYTKYEIIGQSLDRLIPARFAEAHRQHVVKFATEPVSSRIMATRRSVFGLRKDGLEFPAEASISKLHQEGHIFFFVVLRDITEQKRIEEALRDNEQRYKELLESVTNYIYTVEFVNGEPVRTHHSSNCLAVTGYTSQEYEADPHLWYAMIYPTDREVVMAQTAKLKAGEPVQPIEHRIIHKDGSIRWIRNTIVIHVDEAGQVISYDGLISDITESKRLQLQLQAIYALGNKLTRLRNEMAIVERVLRTAVDVLHIESASYGIVNTVANQLEYRYHLTYGMGHSTKVCLPLTEEELDVGVEVIRKRESIYIPDTRLDPRYAPLSARWLGRSELCVPLEIGEEVLGVLRVVSVEANHFTADDQKLLQTLADHTAVAIENAWLYQEIQSRVEELTTLNRRAEVLRQATTALTSTLDLNQVLTSILAQLEHLVPYDNACVLLWQGKELHLAATRAAARPKANGSAAGTVEQNHHFLTVTNILAEQTDNEDFPGWLKIPLMAQGQVIGYLTLENRQVTSFNPGEVALAQAFANQAAAAIHNAKLYKAEREQFRRLQVSQAQLVHAEKMAALGRLMASVAHEINNPLQATQNSLALIERAVNGHENSDKLMHHLKVAGDEIDRISSIVRRVRKFYRPIFDQPQPNLIDDFFRSTSDELQSTDLHAILEHVLELTDKQLEQHRIKIRRDWASDLPHIQGNPNQLKQVFLNLVLNGIDAVAEMAASEGVLFLRTSLVKAEIRNQPLQSAVQIEFGDSGTGMSAETLSRLFEPLFTTKEHGSGLGLFVSYKIIEAHQGQISVESHLGLGTTFTILIPVKQAGA